MQEQDNGRLQVHSDRNQMFPSPRFDFARGKMNELTPIPSRKIQTLRPERKHIAADSTFWRFSGRIHSVRHNRKPSFSVFKNTSKSYAASVRIKGGSTWVLNFPAVCKKKPTIATIVWRNRKPKTHRNHSRLSEGLWRTVTYTNCNI